jgi:biotin carboxyl carrier protein
MATVTIGGRSYDVEVRGDSVIVDGHEFPVTVRDDGAYRTVKAGDAQYRVQLPGESDRASGMQVSVDYRAFAVEYEGRLGGGPAPRAARPPERGGAAVAAPRSSVKGGVTAPIAGKVLRVAVTIGASVSAGDVLIVLEAMKMENEIKAPSDGTVKEILVSEGGRVSEGETLAVVE